MHIPYKGGAPALQALLAGDTQFMFDNLANAMAQVKGGTVRAIAVTTAQALEPGARSCRRWPRPACPASTSRPGSA